MTTTGLSMDVKENFNTLIQEKLIHTPEHVEQFLTYAQLLIEWNKRHNLTAITDMNDIISFHFQDSLMVQKYVDFFQVKSIADIGAGAGFPGLPLKICFPHIELTVIEVNKKKVEFLETVAQTLGLKNIHFYTDDWRTFLRKTAFSIDYFVTRASLAPEELVRAFQPSSHYKDNTIIYWGSAHWQAEKKIMHYVHQDIEYRIKNRRNRYIFLKNV